MQPRTSLLRSLRGLCFALTAALCTAASAAPTLLGDNVTVSVAVLSIPPVTASGIAGTDDLAVITSTPVGQHGFTPTFSASSISFLFSTTFLTSAFIEITGIDALVLDADLSGVAGAASFTDHSARIDLNDQSLRNGTRFQLDLVLRDDVPSAVPEPGMLLTVSLALAGLALQRSRRSA